ncbi:MAG: 2-succinyl-5-enolpyruvyl-6-hydroxy-3-cyclohexene-1-carboxylic-acid synthase [Bdellovibrionota bacterium]
MTNAELVSHFYQILINLEVAEVIVCAGARNAPLVVGLEGRAFKVKSFFEERSAGFYALGKIKASGKPVAIMTTSGTAVAELLPAVVEAYYQGLPLIVISADRPKNYRGSGAPQAIEQAGIFNSYVHSCYDWDVSQTDLKIEFDAKKPLHFNLCFDEPLIDGDFSLITNKFVEVNRIKSFKPQAFDAKYSDEAKLFKNPLVILSQLSLAEKAQAKATLEKYQIYHYAESLSGLLGDADLAHLQLNNCESLFGSFLEKGLFSSVIRVGGVPTLRLWRDLEKKYAQIPVLSVSELPFSGLARRSLQTGFENLDILLNSAEYRKADFTELNQQLQAKKVTALTEFRNSEQNFVFSLSQLIKYNPVYIGNSLPIREWDQFSQGAFPDAYGNRGANGIDGQISTYLGWSDQFEISWAVIGDLTAMYDLAALAINRDDNKNSRKCLVIINNQGGQIFKKVFNVDMFLNPHDIQFQGWAQMFGWNYLQIVDVADLNQVQQLIAKKEAKNFVIEIQTDQQQSNAVWKLMEEACKTVTY